MTYQEFDAKTAELKTLNRQIGQLYRHLVWNYTEIVKLEAQRDALQNEIKFYAPIIAQRVADIQAFWAQG